MGHVPPRPLPAQRAGAQLPRRQHRRAGALRPDLIGSTVSLGRLGESAAAAFLERRGAVITERNVRAGRLEADLVARLGRVRLLVEVKTRLEGEVDPVESLTPAKLRNLRRVAAELRPHPHRIDLVAVTVAEDGVSLRWLPGIA